MLTKDECIKRLASIDKVILTLSAQILAAQRDINDLIVRVIKDEIECFEVRPAFSKIRKDIERRVEWLRPAENQIFMEGTKNDSNG